MLILGLDISSVTTGWCLLNEKKEIINAGYFDTTADDVFQNAKRAIDQIEMIFETYRNIDKIVVEQALMKFMSGQSRANIIWKLASMNAIVTYYLTITKNKEVIMLGSTEARKKAWGESFLSKVWKEKTYENVPKVEWKKYPIRLKAEETYKDKLYLFYKYKVSKRGEEKFITKNYDMLDALTLARAVL